MAKLQWLAKEKTTLWQAWLHRGGRVVLALMLVMAIALTGCGQSSDLSNQESSQTSVGSVKTVPVPAEIAKLDRYMDSYRPKVAIVSPRADEVLQDTQVSVRFNVQDYPLFKDEELGLGPNVHVILDNQPYIAHYDANQPLLLTDLEPGTHTLRVFAARPWHESFKNREAYAQTTFHVFTKTEEYAPQPQLPVLTYSSPSESYGAEPILLDVWLANAPIRESLVPDVPKDWRIRYSLNGKQSTLDRWQPIYITGLKSGRNIVSVELVDGDGQPIRNVFNSAARTIDYHPGGTDTLSKLVRGGLKAEDTLAIVGAVPEPELEPESEIVPEPVVESETEIELVPEPDQASESPDLQATDEDTEEAEEGEPVTEPESVIQPEIESSESDTEPEAATPEMEEVAGDAEDEGLTSPSDAIAKPELDIQPKSSEETKPGLRDELEESKQFSQPEDESEPESSGTEELSKPETGTVEPLTSPSDSTEISVDDIPASRSQEIRSWWQKLRGRSEQDATLKLESDESVSNEIPPVITDGEESLDRTSPVPKEESPIEDSRESGDDRQSEDSLESADETLEPVNTEAAVESETLESGTTAEDTYVLEPDTAAAGLDEDISEDESATGNESTTNTAPAAVKPERQLNFWQKFLRDREPIPSEKPAVVPESPAQLTAPEVTSAEEELELPAETAMSGEETAEEIPPEEIPVQETPAEEPLVEVSPVEVPSSSRQSKEPAEPDKSAPLEEDVAEPDSQTKSVPQPERPRSFLQRLQQKRQQLPTTNRPSLTPAPDSVDESAGATEESETDVDTATQPEPEESENSAPSKEQASEAPPASTSDRSRFYQRFQQERQQPTTRPNLLTEPKGSGSSLDIESESDADAKDTPSPTVKQPAAPPPAEDIQQEVPLARPRGFLQKLRQEQRQSPPSANEIPSTLSIDGDRSAAETPVTETPAVEPEEQASPPDIPLSKETAETTREAQQPEPEQQQDSALSTQTDRPRGFLQRFQRRNQRSVEPSTQLPAVPEAPQVEDIRPEVIPQVAEDEPTAPDNSSDTERSYPFLEQLKRDRDRSSTDSSTGVTSPIPTSPVPARPNSGPQQKPDVADRLRSSSLRGAPSPDRPSSPSQSGQETLGNFTISSESSPEQNREITTVEKPRNPGTERTRSLLPSSISDQPQWISIPPRL